MESKLKTLLYSLIPLLLLGPLQAQDWQTFGYEKLPGAEDLLYLDFLSSDLGWAS